MWVKMYAYCILFKSEFENVGHLISQKLDDIGV